MERRFALIEEVGVRDIFNYNAVTKDDPDREFMPQMVIIIDELADLMMTAKEAVESSICRLAQKARAAGIHIIIGTQRPSVDVITGLLKANIPSRIACTVASQVDSRTIIDIAGAERLVGKGDMLFAPVGLAKPMRVQGAFVHESEVEKIVSFIKENNVGAKYNEEFIRLIDEEAAKCTASNKKGGAAAAAGGEVEGGLDPKFKEAVELAIDSGKVATSLLQRRLEVGYGRAAKIIDQMEQMGFVSAPDGNKPRKILVTKEQFMQMAINDEI
jgi:S-DNA-T family DNA segregation ATPase FtsK/SpoIIIE